MIHRERIFLYFFLFLSVEILLFFYVDRSLSIYLHDVDRDNARLIDFFRAYTDFGKSQWYLWPSGLGGLICIGLLNSSNLSDGLREKVSTIGKQLVFFFSCVALSGIITDLIKPIIGRARPVLWEHEKIYGLSPFSFHATWNSMPSGHATTAITLAVVLTLLVPRGRLIWWGIGIALAGSRVMVNAHYLSDILAGSCVAIITVYGLDKVFSSHRIVKICNNIFPLNKKRPAL